MTDAVGIACLEEAPRDAEHVHGSPKHCTLVGLARRGQIIWAANEDLGCPIARFVLGCPSDGGGRQAAARSFVESRLAEDHEAAQRFLAGFPTLAPRQRTFLYFPVGAGRTEPDLVIYFLSANEAMRRIRAVVTATGERAELRTGGSAAMCADCTVAPLTTGCVALSVGCPGSRREVPLAEHEVLLAIPARVERVLRRG